MSPGSDVDEPSDALRLLILTPNAENNSLGRTWCLWLLARHFGWQVRVAAVRGRQLWGPLAAGYFAEDCEVLTALSEPARAKRLDELARWSEVIIAVKPLPTSFGLARGLVARIPRPLVLDIDDLDIEYRLRWAPLRQRLRDARSGRRRDLQRLREAARTVPVMVCSPLLAESYGGTVIPHVRPAVPASPNRAGRDIIVRFIGSPRGHKGVEGLRSAIATFQGAGVRLEVTDTAPPDAQPWERWLGQTTVEEGLRLVAGADVIALPSLAKSWSFGQLPAKLIDAMVLGRAIVASDVGPIRWALGDAGILVPPGQVAALAEALDELRDPHRRAQLGAAAYRRALACFTVDAVAPAFDRCVRNAIAAYRAAPVGHPARPASDPPHSAVVAVLSYRRPVELAALLPELVRQARLAGVPTTVLVVDNDAAGGGAAIARAADEPLVRSVIEKVPGIAAARNRALAEASADDLLVFIDDDEWPSPDWLALLLATFTASGATAVVGPVVSEYAEPPSRWIAEGRFFDRRRLATGTEVAVAATNNLLLDLRRVRAMSLTFDAAFGISGGSDTLSRRQLVAQGGRLVWNDEALVVDRVPASRLTRSWVLKRAFRSGNGWSRTSLVLATTPSRQLRERAVIGSRGVVRVCGGSARYLAGVATGSIGRRARGSRTVLRGAGMIAGVAGLSYAEYRRPPEPASAADQGGTATP